MTCKTAAEDQDAIAAPTDAADATVSETTGGTFDASWWEAVTRSSDVAEFEPAELIHEQLKELARLADVDDGAESLRARTLSAMARATSAMLDPDSWDQPFSAAIVTSTSRTVIPSDLDAHELTLLAEAVALVEPAVLRARMADVVWTYRFPRDPRSPSSPSMRTSPHP